MQLQFQITFYYLILAFDFSTYIYVITVKKYTKNWPISALHQAVWGSGLWIGIWPDKKQLKLMRINL